MLNEKSGGEILARRIIETEDGSSSIFIPDLNEHYHSTHGAVVEALHVYIDAGFNFCAKDPCFILEAGFGTGLNALLTLQEAQRKQKSVVYHSFEKYPLVASEYLLLNYEQCVDLEFAPYLKKMHEAMWGEDVEICPGFVLHKHYADFYDMDFDELFDVVYYDAFNPDIQPHLWSKDLLQHFYDALKKEGILTTYCVKGVVKQAMRDCGFMIKRLPGPPGKHQMLRAIK